MLDRPVDGWSRLLVSNQPFKTGGVMKRLLVSRIGSNYYDRTPGSSQLSKSGIEHTKRAAAAVKAYCHEVDQKPYLLLPTGTLGEQTLKAVLAILPDVGFHQNSDMGIINIEGDNVERTIETIKEKGKAHEVVWVFLDFAPTIGVVNVLTKGMNASLSMPLEDTLVYLINFEKSTLQELVA
jgi:hypothetical protein